MPENTATMPLAPMEPDDIADAFACIRALQADNIDTACTVANTTGPELHRLLLDVAARVIIPVTAADGHDTDPCAHSFLAGAPGIAQTIIRFTDDHEDVADVLRQLEAVGVGQALDAHPAPAGTSEERTTGA
ncbi:hypothetical protein [Streptomyces uncialis]|uniref:hypothetical protein n=1 Tax=Streptomyces uncialis TaxID=1048205 RepID=UPI0037AE056D